MLSTLGAQLRKALDQMSSQTLLNDASVKKLINDLSMALLSADVNIQHVKAFTEHIKKIPFESLPAAMNKRKFVKSQVIKYLLQLLGGNHQELIKSASQEKNFSSPKSALSRPNSTQNCHFEEISPIFKKNEPKKECKVVLFVGLNGAGKTTTACKYAHYFQKRQRKVALVCCDTFRAGAFDQLKQNALRAKIPFYGSYTERDPVVTAKEGIQEFSREMDLILLDSAGRHSQDSALFEEMKELVQIAQPDEVVYVVDGSIGQSARDQALAFQSAVPIHSVIVTKLDTENKKGGGALSAVADLKVQISFIGTGEHLLNFEKFNPQRFLERLLGMGDLTGFMDAFVTSIPTEVASSAARNSMNLFAKKRGTFTFQDFREQIGLLNGQSLEQMLSFLPQKMLSSGKKSALKQTFNVRNCTIVIDSMTSEELQQTDTKLFNKQPNRVLRLSKGCGQPLSEIQKVLDMFKQYSQSFQKMNPLMLKQLLPKFATMPTNSLFCKKSLMKALKK